MLHATNENAQEQREGDDISNDLDSLRRVLGYNPNDERDEQGEGGQYDVQYEVYEGGAGGMHTITIIIITHIVFEICFCNTSS